MIVLAFPAPQLRGELSRCPECHAAIEFLSVGPVATLDLAIDLRTTRRNVPVGDAKIPEMPREVGAEFVPVVGLDALNRHGQSLTHLIYESNRVRDGVVSVDPENPVAGRLVHRGELVEAPATELEVLHVDLN